MSTVVAAQEVLAGGFSMNSLPTIGAAALTFGGALAGLKSGYTKVEAGERGVRLRFGRAFKKNGDPYGILPPGQYLSIPFTHGIKKIDVRDRPTNLMKDFLVDSIDDKQLIVNAMAIWSVSAKGTDPYKALFEIVGGEDAREKMVAQLCTAGLSKALRSRTYEEIARDESVKNEVMGSCAEPLLDNYGIALSDVQVTSLAYSPFEKIGRKMVEAASLRAVGEDVTAETDSLMGAAFAAGYEATGENGSPHLSIVPR